MHTMMLQLVTNKGVKEKRHKGMMRTEQVNRGGYRACEDEERNGNNLPVSKTRIKKRQ